ncbi:MAG: SDR family NAD(P)-dependent oxidoreductase [Clostridia bacterium]|nr:SDR family NAD(P)-dependent oxidoreductase [Clostridia bacterium]
MSAILITGASHGVGRAFAVACAQSGRFSKIILNSGSDKAALEDTARRVSAAGDLVCAFDAGDVSDLAYVRGLRERFGPVDTLVNNAAVSYVGLLTDMAPEDWDRVMRVNVTALYNTCHTYVPDMIRAGGGRILNVSSVWGLAGASCEVAYSASKGAVNAFTKALAKELAPSHIRVNAIAPGILDTRMNAHLSENETAEIRDQIPAGYIASPEEAAQAMLRLLEMPEYFNGEIVRFDGCWI